MLELPEAAVIAKQMNHTIKGKRIKNVIVGQSPHKFAFYHEDPLNYPSMLIGKVIGTAVGHGGQLEVQVEDTRLLFGDGVALRFQESNEKIPLKHQLLITFDDLSSLSGSVQMYGGLWCFNEGEFDNPYYLVAKEKPSPVTDLFDQTYFEQILNVPKVEKLSAKALLATEQRIPGLGNGVLQDILFHSGIHPKKKVKDFTSDDKDKLYQSIKATLQKMINLGGRDTEKDLFGTNGGYTTILSKNNVDKPCPVCGTAIKKEAYLGGSIYYCVGCQGI